MRVCLRLAVVERGGRVLLFRRPESSRLLAGLWDLPWVESGAGAAAAFAERYGGSWRLGRPLGRVRHAITHRSIEAEVLAARIDDAAAVAEGLEARWVDEREAGDLPLSSLVRKALREAGLGWWS